MTTLSPRAESVVHILLLNSYFVIPTEWGMVTSVSTSSALQ